MFSPFPVKQRFHVFSVPLAGHAVRFDMEVNLSTCMHQVLAVCMYVSIGGWYSTGRGS